MFRCSSLSSNITLGTPFWLLLVPSRDLVPSPHQYWSPVPTTTRPQFSPLLVPSTDHYWSPVPTTTGPQSWPLLVPSPDYYWFQSWLLLVPSPDYWFSALTNGFQCWLLLPWSLLLTTGSLVLTTGSLVLTTGSLVLTTNSQCWLPVLTTGCLPWPLDMVEDGDGGT